MDGSINFDHDPYRRTTEAANHDRKAPPTEEHGENRRSAVDMHPVLRTLSPRNPGQVHADSAVKRKRAPAPTATNREDYSKVIDIMDRYGDGESIAELQKSFPNISYYLKEFGICYRSGPRMLQNLSEDQFDRLKDQIKKRIENSANSEMRSVARTQLDSDFHSATEVKRLTRETAQNTIEWIIELLPAYAAGKPIITITGGRSFQKYMHVDGTYGKLGLELLKYATPDQKKKMDHAVKSRRALVDRLVGKGGNDEKAVSLMKKRGFGTLYKKPDLMLSISTRFSNPTSSIEDASSSYLTPSHLMHMVDEKTGELTDFFEGVISRASESTKSAIRANFKRHYQKQNQPSDSPPPNSHREQENPPAPLFFSEVSADWRRMGYRPEPDTPQYPPQSPDSTFSGLSSMSPYGREFDLDTPQEQSWTSYGDYGTRAPMEYPTTPATGPERVDVDDIPSPQDVEDPALPPVTATSWLQDGHLHAYTHDLARRLQGEPLAQLLNFADPQVVAMLMDGDRTQKGTAQRRLLAPNTPPIVFLPINNPNAHWSLLVVDRRTREAFHYDSSVHPMQAENATGTDQYRLASRAARAMGIDADVQGVPIAQQQNGYSCGDHVLTGIEVLAHRVIAGTFRHTGGTDLSAIRPHRGLIRRRIAPGEQAPAESSAIRVPEPPAEQQKKKPRPSTYF